MDDQDVRGDGCQRHRRKILRGVVRNFAEKGWIDDEARANDGDRVAVRLSACSGRHANVASGTGLVLDIEVLTQAQRQLLSDQPRQDVGRTARSEGHNHVYRFLRVLACVYRGTLEGSKGCNGQNGERVTKAGEHWATSCMCAQSFSRAWHAFGIAEDEIGV